MEGEERKEKWKFEILVQVTECRVERKSRNLKLYNMERSPRQKRTLHSLITHMDVVLLIIQMLLGKNTKLIKNYEKEVTLNTQKN